MRTLPRDRLQPMVSRGAPRGQGEGNRVAQLERQMTFLRQQHHDTLQHLHREIERLKNENRGERLVRVHHELWVQRLRP